MKIVVGDSAVLPMLGSLFLLYCLLHMVGVAHYFRLSSLGIDEPESPPPHPFQGFLIVNKDW